MFSISTKQVEALENEIGVRFVCQLLALLREEYPACFSGLPDFVSQAMVVNGIQASLRCGFTLQSHIGGFVTLQCSTSPDFFLHPAIVKILSISNHEKLKFHYLMHNAPESIWNEIKLSANPMAWFSNTNNNQAIARMAYHVCSTFPEFANTQSEAQLFSLFKIATEKAARYGIDWEEGIAIFATALVLYGSRLDETNGTTWSKKVFSLPHLSPEKIANLLRLRIALDTDKLI
ncbi:MAG: hypothetical protein NTV43_18400 [Methylococcales bacterium]|nr:hypothetical protein [Methylococcales bacterium]